MRGADLAGLVSTVTNMSSGFQSAGLISTAHSLNGFQSSGLYGKVRRDAIGYQVSGLVCRITGDLNGVQAAGLVNLVGGNTFGGQSGFLNVAQNVTGFQAGLINVSRELNGVPLGLINITGNGWVNAIVYFSNFSGVNVGAKFVANNFVTTVTVGGYDYDSRLDSAASFSASWGYHVPFEPYYLEIDLANMTLVQLADFDRENIHRRHLMALRLTLGWDVAGFFGLFGGVAAGYEREYHGETNISRDFKPLIYAGVTLF
ncbi:hypothetical protein CHISP_2285 [Chitinispirillum alkaliphilum]|nr:hypothetical protein CHISP_2285 [Chitinispirillum alkaliphilum]